MTDDQFNLSLTYAYLAVSKSRGGQNELEHLMYSSRRVDRVAGEGR